MHVPLLETGTKAPSLVKVVPRTGLASKVVALAVFALILLAILLQVPSILKLAHIGAASPDALSDLSKPEETSAPADSAETAQESATRSRPSLNEKRSDNSRGSTSSTLANATGLAADRKTQTANGKTETPADNSVAAAQTTSPPPTTESAEPAATAKPTESSQGSTLVIDNQSGIYVDLSFNIGGASKKVGLGPNEKATIDLPPAPFSGSWSAESNRGEQLIWSDKISSDTIPPGISRSVTLDKPDKFMTVRLKNQSPYLIDRVTINGRACRCTVAADGIFYNLGGYKLSETAAVIVHLQSGTTLRKADLKPVRSGEDWSLAVVVDDPRR